MAKSAVNKWQKKYYKTKPNIYALRKYGSMVYVGMARPLGNLKVTQQPIKLINKVSTKEAPHLRKRSLAIV